jgi:hypothetical protein
MANTRHANRGLRKICGCPRRTWAKCPHSWHFNFKPKGGPAFRFSVDSEAGKHIESKGDAEALADDWRSQIRAGTFRRSHETAPAATVASDVVTPEKFGETYATRLGRPVSRNHQTCFKQFAAFVAPGTEKAYGARALTSITEDDIETFFAHLTERDVAHGHTPTWVRNNSLSPASREAFRAIDLTFHDLRHEAGSRLLEAGWPLHNVSHMLGHANIAQTSTYLNATRVGLQDAMRRLDASRCKPVASEGSVERAPLLNEQDENTAQGLVN